MAATASSAQALSASNRPGARGALSESRSPATSGKVVPVSPVKVAANGLAGSSSRCCKATSWAPRRPTSPKQRRGASPMSRPASAPTLAAEIAARRLSRPSSSSNAIVQVQSHADLIKSLMQLAPSDLRVNERRARGTHQTKQPISKSFSAWGAPAPALAVKQAQIYSGMAQDRRYRCGSAVSTTRSAPTQQYTQSERALLAGPEFDAESLARAYYVERRLNQLRAARSFDRGVQMLGSLREAQECSAAAYASNTLLRNPAGFGAAAGDATSPLTWSKFAINQKPRVQLEDGALFASSAGLDFDIGIGGGARQENSASLRPIGIQRLASIPSRPHDSMWLTQESGVQRFS
eukprot:1112743-Pleurochrysis_carterae.AAC.1